MACTLSQRPAVTDPSSWFVNHEVRKCTPSVFTTALSGRAHHSRNDACGRAPASSPARTSPVRAVLRLAAARCELGMHSSKEEEVPMKQSRVDRTQTEREIDILDCRAVTAPRSATLQHERHMGTLAKMIELLSDMEDHSIY